ncbi:MAG: ATP-binding protein, partial [Cyanobacteria bacterium J06554_3]
MFVSDLSGILMKVEENETTRYRYELWFDYTRQAMNTLAEGAMLVVPNFASDRNQTCYSILEVTGILPMHYALGTDIGGYPGFITEAARNAGQDWVTQEAQSTEDTTKIRCVAIPTNLEIVEAAFSPNGQGPTIQEESNLPMVGHEVRLLNTQMTEQVANLSLDLETDHLIHIGSLVRDPEVRVFVRVEELIKVHFGIFGFTGAGKSNLLSTLVRRLLSANVSMGQPPIKIVIFDLMSEYTGLLLDQLEGLNAGFIVNIGAQTTPESVVTYYSERTHGDKQKNYQNLEKATIDFVNSTVLPKALKRRQGDLHRPAAKFLMAEKMRFWQQRSTVKDAIATAKDQFKGNMGACDRDVYGCLKDLTRRHGSKNIDSAIVEEIEAEIAAFVDDYDDDPANRKAKKKITSTARKNLDVVVDVLVRQAQQSQVKVPGNVTVSIPQIVEWLNDPTQSSLIIIQSHNPDDLRDFAATLSNVIYESRRRSGNITPLVSFIFDEADEFIPGNASSNDSKKRSKAAVMTLARRGRKFGLGIGISTQRIANLDVNTLAQPHTYFVSKLPREYDRRAIAEAFGISEDMFRQTFRFKKGDWLLASYDATGLEALPIPIHAEDANKAILDFVD